MTATVQLEHELDLRCTCGNELTATYDSMDDVLHVEVCDDCVDRAEERAREEGYNDGHSDGWSEGHEAGMAEEDK